MKKRVRLDLSVCTEKVFSISTLRLTQTQFLEAKINQTEQLSEESAE